LFITLGTIQTIYGQFETLGGTKVFNVLPLLFLIARPQDGLREAYVQRGASLLRPIGLDQTILVRRLMLATGSGVLAFQGDRQNFIDGRDRPEPELEFRFVRDVLKILFVILGNQDFRNPRTQGGQTLLFKPANR
jgi:hypothetical protein